MEATTLASAPLIYFHRHHRSLEATWKYLLICSVGIALRLLGNFLMVIAASRQGGEGIAIVVDALIENGANLNVPWLRAASFLPGRLWNEDGPGSPAHMVAGRTQESRR